MPDHETYLREATELALANVAEGGSPYGAVIVREGAVVARAANRIHRTNDPSDHAEMVALREASQRLGRPKLDDCIVYASGRPCPMCHAAMRLAGISRGYFAFTAEEAEAEGLISAGIYAELCRPLEEQPMQVRHHPVPGEPSPYRAWAERKGR
ncbi:Guanine deaminase [Methylorubrum aminovorans]|uniref:Guanine deaminase n=1 Tax=Methylorubrum aminovorans TaxID=269069 RepID=A0ABQ4UH72_9HYPH|nr:nucleoside deaminase [Methylorubrum aminovorans]GJE65135.1 Guanine deaminase [Methylorubrum aminovorans]GMA73780.1 tRNA-specific adenosine deaminase [Methylorubrum aminovorans]